VPFPPSYYPEEISREEELASLRSHAKYMEEELKAAEKRIAELEEE
jgi:hypothetical protein